MWQIKVTGKQIRFFLPSGRVGAIQPLHVAGGVPKNLQGCYSVSLDEQRRYGWGTLSGPTELRIFRKWVKDGLKQ
jgi:hypothetical protein